MPNEGRSTAGSEGRQDQGLRTGKGDYEYKGGRQGTGGIPNPDDQDDRESAGSFRGTAEAGYRETTTKTAISRLWARGSLANTIPQHRIVQLTPAPISVGWCLRTTKSVRSLSALHGRYLRRPPPVAFFFYSDALHET